MVGRRAPQEARGLPGGSVVENLPANAGDMNSIPGSGRSPGRRNGAPLQCSCLGNPMDRGAWRATVGHGWTTEQEAYVFTRRICEYVKLWATGALQFRLNGGSDDKESACNAGDPGSIPES